jgi:hypothetical protein
MSASGWGEEEKSKTNNSEQGSDPKEQGQGSRRLIKSYPSKSTRITLRSTQPTGTIRPPWNSGLPSPNSTKAVSTSTKRTLHRKFPVRPKLPAPEDFSSLNLKDVPQAATSSIEQSTRCQTPEPTKTAIPSKDPETDLTWEYDRLKAFLERAAATTSPENHVGLKEPRSRAYATMISEPDITEDLLHPFAASPMFKEQIEEDSFLDSELMTSPRLKLPLSLPATVENRHGTMAGKWPSLHIDTETYNYGQIATRRPAPPLPEMIKIPCSIIETWQTPRAPLDPETSDDEQVTSQIPALDLELSHEERAAAQKATRSDPQSKLRQKSSAEGQVSSRRIIQPTEKVSRAQHSTPSLIIPTWARIVRGASPCPVDRESSGEEWASMSRSILNRSRRLRQSRSQSSIKSVKWDPAIIACGPKMATRDTVSQPEVDTSPDISEEALKEQKREDNLEIFGKTVSRLKKGDRKAIRKLLEALKNLENDDEQVTKPKQPSRKLPKKSGTVSNTASGKGLNPRAPTFREGSSQKSINDSQPDTAFFDIGRNRPNRLQNSNDETLSVEDDPKTCKPITCAIHSNRGLQISALPKQGPIWINTFQQPPTIIDQEDDDFQEFCRVNNFIPLIPVNPIPFIPPTSMEPVNPVYTPYLTLEADSCPMIYRLPFDSMEPTLLTVQTRQAQPLETASNEPYMKSGNISKQPNQPTAALDLISLLEETSEPIEDGCREAKALDPVWGAQILENFLKKYPMTGQCKPEDPISNQNENQKPTAKAQQKQRTKFGGKAAGVNSYNAAEIQQKLEMILLQQKARVAPTVPAPAYKIKATQIQQKLEIMLYKQKERKALEGFSKQVLHRAQKLSERRSGSISQSFG